RLLQLILLLPERPGDLVRQVPYLRERRPVARELQHPHRPVRPLQVVVPAEHRLPAPGEVELHESAAERPAAEALGARLDVSRLEFQTAVDVAGDRVVERLAALAARAFD